MNTQITVKHLLIVQALTLLLVVVLAIGAGFATASLMDTPGPRGAQGAQGVGGTNGERGPRGKRGKRGRVGKTGLAGANGVNGATIVEQACSNDINVPLPYC
jgi:hypothetical protein